MSYFNPQDKPTLSSEGYHKAKFVYDKQNRKVEELYYGTNGQPILVNNYHKETFKYTENSDKIIEEALFDTNGKPVNCSGGWHKVVLTYNEDGTVAETKKYYLANGTLLATMKWNGDDWVIVQKEYIWQNDSRELASELPYSYGGFFYVYFAKSKPLNARNLLKYCLLNKEICTILPVFTQKIVILQSIVHVCVHDA